jgi:hypothetical protein
MGGTTRLVWVSALLLVAACGDAATGVDAGKALQGSFALEQIDGASLPIAQRRIVSIDTSGTTTSSCTDYLTTMRIDVTSSGSATRSESHTLTCDDGANDTSITLESGTVSSTGDGWRFDFTRTDLAVSAHYYGRLEGATLTIVRRETDALSTGPVGVPQTVSLSQLVFRRL